MSSAGVHWILLDSTKVWLFRWIPLESGYSTGFCQSPVDSGFCQSPVDSGICQSPVDFLSGKSLDGFRGLRRNMLVSSGLRRTPPGINMPIWPLSHQDIPEFESGGFREFLAEKVGESVQSSFLRPNFVLDFQQQSTTWINKGTYLYWQKMDTHWTWTQSLHSFNTQCLFSLPSSYVTNIKLKFSWHSKSYWC